MSKKSGSNCHLGFAGLLTIAFIVLKLTGHIDWSWWWVLAPIWLPIAVLLGILVVCFLGAAVLTALEKRT